MPVKSVKLPRDIFEWLKKEKEQSGIPGNTTIIFALQDYIQKRTHELVSAAINAQSIATKEQKKRVYIPECQLPCQNEEICSAMQDVICPDDKKACESYMPV